MVVRMETVPRRLGSLPICPFSQVALLTALCFCGQILYKMVSAVCPHFRTREELKLLRVAGAKRGVPLSLVQPKVSLLMPPPWPLAQASSTIAIALESPLFFGQKGGVSLRQPPLTRPCVYGMPLRRL
mmetsp:Transcript_42617/g.84048  ORF Transcript_42617/g.84048 Transcript_42617/m.84048 type:complete len:128 (+) Transcript_42617:774-1157(+)